MDKIS